MIKVDIISGVLGAGKSTLILRLLDTVYSHEAVALVENEQGKVRLSKRAVQRVPKFDTPFSDSGVSVTEIPFGCICCSRSDMLEQTITDISRRGTFGRLILEPSGTARLADLLPLIQRRLPDGAQIHHIVSVVDASSFDRRRLLSEDFFDSQLRNSPLIFLSKTDLLPPEETKRVQRLILSIAPDCYILKPDLSDWDRMAPIAAPLAAHSIPALSRYRTVGNHLVIFDPECAENSPGPGRQ